MIRTGVASAASYCRSGDGMILKGKDLMSDYGLRKYVDDNLNGFTVELDEVTGELIIRTNLTVGDDGLLQDLSTPDDGTDIDAPETRKRTWYASPNGDWWGNDVDSPGYVYVVTEDQIPKDRADDIEEDKFEDVIMEYGTKHLI